MAVPKDKLAAALGLKYKGKSISKTLVNDLATDWADDITDEEGIDAFLTTNDKIVNTFIKEADRRATASAQKAKADIAQSLGDDKPAPVTTTIDDNDTPAWAKALMLQNQQLVERVNGFESANTAKTITEQFKNDPRVKDIPDFIRNGYIPKTGEEFETKATELATAYQQFATQNKLSNFGTDNLGRTGGEAKQKSEASKEEMDAVVKNLNI